MTRKTQQKTPRPNTTRIGYKPRPVIGVLTNRKLVRADWTHSITEYYIHAVEQVANAEPCLVPCQTGAPLRSLLERLDGVLLTGGLSNVHPRYYGVTPHADLEPYDETRDESSFSAIATAQTHDMPLLAICLGMQELNVALGGTLQNNIQDKKGHLPHKDNFDPSPDIRYGERHEATLVPEGKLAALLGAKPIRINSLHAQAIDKLGKGLEVEAYAPDGIIEAVSMRKATFGFGVQWHPEYAAAQRTPSQKLFGALGEAARQFLHARKNN